MFDMQRIKDNFSKSAKQYDDHAQLQCVVRKHAVQLAMQYWKGDGHILDAGCGTGVLASEISGYQLCGFDISAGMCAEARNIMPHCVNADVCYMPFAKNSFDGVLSSLMLQWVDDVPAALAEMHRVLKPEGIAVITTLLSGTLYELQAAFAAVDDRPHVSEFLDMHTMLEYIKQSGFLLAVAKHDKIVEYYPDTVALMRSLQAIGATNKHKARSKGLMTPAKLTKMEHAYAPFCHQQGLPATWQVLTLVVRKGAA